MKLRETAFYILGVNTLHSKEVIHELADAKSFVIDETLCKNLERALCNPNSRIEHEIAWLPGVDPRETPRLLAVERAEDFLQAFDNASASPHAPIVWCNILSDVLGKTTAGPVCISAPEVVEQSVNAAIRIDEQLDAGNVMALVNKDRAQSGFPLVADREAVEEVLEARRREMYTAVREYLESSAGNEETQVLNRVADVRSHAAHGSELFDKLAADYELRKHDEIGKLGKDVCTRAEKLLKAIQQAKGVSRTYEPEGLKSLVSKIAEWHMLVRPVLVSHRKRGMRFEPAEGVIRCVRHTYLEAFNKFNCENVLVQLVDAVSFAKDELPQFAEAISEDFRFVDSLHPQERKIKCIESTCGQYFDVPAEYGELARAYKKLLEHAYDLMNRGCLDEKASDAVALLLLKYGAAVANRFGRFDEAREMLERAMEYACGDDVKSFIQENIDKLNSNKEYMSKNFPSFVERARLGRLHRRSLGLVVRRIAVVLASAFALSAVLVGGWLVARHADWFKEVYISSLSDEELLAYVSDADTETKDQVSKELIGRIEQYPMRYLDDRSPARFASAVGEYSLRMRLKSSRDPFAFLAYQAIFPNNSFFFEKELKPAFDRAIDAKIQAAADGHHIAIEDGNEEAGSGETRIDITNRTRNTLYIFYSGPERRVEKLESFTLCLPHRIVLKSGSYRIAVFGTTERVVPMYGVRTMAPGTFSETIQ